MSPPAVLDLFLELAAIPSPPGEEAAVAGVVTGFLRDLAQPVDSDEHGNVLCRLAPTAAGTPVFLCAHMDTVPPEGSLEPVVEDGVVRNAGGTILGGDNKAALASMLVAVQRLLNEGRPHAGVELLLTVREEVGLLGAKAFDHTRLGARVGYVYDHAAPIGGVVLGAPTQRSLRVRFHGRAAHAGMYPEEGRSAVAAAARAIADFRLGRIDDETTANVGTVKGGTARNVVPEWCEFEAEARSQDPGKVADLVREMLETIAFAGSLGDCEVETQLDDTYEGYRFRRDELAVRLSVAALERSGYTPSFLLSGGGADANVFNTRGLTCVNLANGMAEIHTPDEHIAVDDLERMVEVTLALVDVARETDASA